MNPSTNVSPYVTAGLKSRRACSLEMPASAIQRLPNNGPYQRAPRANPRIVATKVATSDTAGISPPVADASTAVFARLRALGASAWQTRDVWYVDWMTFTPFIWVVAVAVLAAGCSSQRNDEEGATGAAPAAAAAATERRYLLEQVDDAAVVQLYADGFSSLPLREKTLIYHLYLAALAGRDIYYDQRYAHNLAMRDVLEEIVTHADGIDPGTLAEIHRYTKLFWINTGPYNNLTARKFVLQCSRAAFAAAIAQARTNGARIPADAARLDPYFFDLDVDPLVTSKTPGPGRDILQASANNLYAG